MADEHPKDWSEKIQDLAIQGKKIASIGLQETVKSSRVVIEKSKEIANKGFGQSIQVSKSVAKKGKDLASKGVENTKSVAQSVQQSTQQRLEQRRFRKENISKDAGNESSELRFTEAESLGDASEDVSGLTIHDLKLRLKFLGLAVNGKKNALVERLRAAKESSSSPKKSSTRLELEERILLIEEEYPEVLKPLPPEDEFQISHSISNLTYLFCGLALVAYSFLLLLSSHLSPRSLSVRFESPVIDLILPSYAKAPQFSSLDSSFDTLFLLTGFLLVLASGILLCARKKSGATLLLGYFICIAFVGRLVFSFVSNIELGPADYQQILSDFIVFTILCSFAYLPRLVTNKVSFELSSGMQDEALNRSIPANIPNTDAYLEHIIQEGFDMDFRAEVAKPKPPRARAKFEGYEKILLSVSFILWPFTIFMTMAYDGGLVAFTDYSSELIQVVSVWSLSLLTLISLVRFDRSARGNGWYAKEKETYVGMMDLYSKAQAKHYEYVELRAAAEAQEILEKYPQLDKTKSSAASQA
ncbi:MAG: hypothetical protein ISR21_07940 [Candidatus Poseidoniaceae archaeon]|nr:hypothetical protein [Candidatus Poseidoniaceae archaeon]